LVRFLFCAAFLARVLAPKLAGKGREIKTRNRADALTIQIAKI
jgi:hypothetical protein